MSGDVEAARKLIVKEEDSRTENLTDSDNDQDQQEVQLRLADRHMTYVKETHKSPATLCIVIQVMERMLIKKDSSLIQ